MCANVVTTSATTGVGPARRALIMISHANPEDDEVTVWLASQLAIDGYQVWTDKARFLVGEYFWPTVDPIIRDHAVKFIFVLSYTSNRLSPVRGFNKELELALQTERSMQTTDPADRIRFVLPVAVDNLPTSAYNIHFTGKDVLPFRNWAQGYATLRRALQEDNVPKFRSIGPSTVSEWWNLYRSVDEGLKQETHKVFSNEFPITSLPEHFYVHNIQYFGESQHVDVSLDAPVAIHQNGFELYTFATSTELRRTLGPDVVLELRDKPIPLASVLDPQATRELRSHRPHLVGLLRVAWERAMEANNNIRLYGLASGRLCAYFPKPADAAALSIVVSINSESQGRRFLVRSFGRKRSLTEADAAQRVKYYHIGIDARPLLRPLCYQINTHVLFSDDGAAPWQSKRRMHRYRRTFCAGWYNDRWRDCLLGFLQQLAGSNLDLKLQAATNKDIRVACIPNTYESDEYFPRAASPGATADDEMEIVEEMPTETEEENDEESSEEAF